jgi:TPR repeat protein
MSEGLCLHRKRSPEDIQQLRAWYKIRGLLICNSDFEDLQKAIQLGSACKHHNAVWLTRLFAGREAKTMEEAKKVFLECGESFAANLGDAYAQALMARQTFGDECFAWAKKSALQGERDGFYQLGNCFASGEGCSIDNQKAMEYIFVAAELESVVGMISYCELLSKADPNDFTGWEKLLLDGWR